MIKDENLVKMKATVESILPGSRIILFGSRSRGDYESQSDYDILVIVKQNLNVKEKRQYASLITDKLAEIEILVDVIVKTEDDINYYRDKIGSITREAVLKGINI